ncbi:HNH endonuclease [Providencia manganoxydans]|uniref:HNH endonuclease n=1 Tax=Providencia manganoxydans TaxID=2923283 RepID=UPI00280DAB1B|nr:hypothetical protein [Providencia stuartii]
MCDNDEIIAIEQKIDIFCENRSTIPWGKDKYSDNDAKKFEEIYDSLKKIMKNKQKYKCCYCGASFIGSHEINIDVEHILPSSIFDLLTLYLSNISVACKRCNMGIKHDDLSFFEKDKDCYEILNKSKIIGDSLDYKIIHPNHDVYSDYIKKININHNENIIPFFIKNVHETKAAYHYNYFQLEKITRSYLDMIQGIEPRKTYLRASSVDMLKSGDGKISR